MATREPWSLQPHQFDAWYNREIVTGLSTFKDDCGRVIDQVVQVMYRHMPLNVKEVVKGGSLGKGTVLKGQSDFDCVVFVNPPALPYLRDVQSVSAYVSRDLAKATENIVASIRNNSRVNGSPTRSAYMVSANLLVPGMQIKVDMLPTADNLAFQGKASLYDSMIRRSVQDREPYSAGLVKLQVDFIREKPGVVKELIRVVKYWNKVTVRSALESRWLSGSLPTSYPMELITVYAWERAGRPYAFNRLQGVKAVLTIFSEELSSLSHFWTDNYNSSIAQRGIASMDPMSKMKPLVLDPANPTNNVCARFRGSWDDVARVARDTLRSNLLINIRVGSKWQ